MPKQTLTLNDFSGGINNLKDPRDIDISELSGAKNVLFDQQGAIRSIGENANHADAPSQTSSSSAGYGLFYYSTDHKKSVSYNASTISFDASPAKYDKIEDSANGFIANGFSAGMEISVSGSTSNDGLYRIVSVAAGAMEVSPVNALTTEAAGDSVTITGTPELGEDWFALADPLTNQIDLYDKTNDSWVSGSLDLSDGAPASPVNLKPVYYFVDEAVRVSDSGFNESAHNEIYQYIRREHFTGTAAEDSYDGWYENDQNLTAPSTGDIVTGETYPTAGLGFNVKIYAEAAGGFIKGAEEYEFAQTLIYDNNQESLLTVMSTAHTTGGAAGTDTRNFTNVHVYATRPFDEDNGRESGGRIYWREKGTGDEWVLFLDISLRDGVRSGLFGDYKAWEDGTSVGTNVKVVQLAVDSIGVDTYEIINGYPQDDKSISIGADGMGYKSAVVTNRRVFIANVKTKNEDGETVEMRDRIMYSPVNRFDTFPTSFFIDVVKGDSEEYTALASFADRLLAFKNRTLYVLNISGSASEWFLESTNHFAGVEHPAAVTTTDFGIVWANKHGCYLYNGEVIVNLISEKIRDSGVSADLNLYNETWPEFFDGDGNTIVGYAPKYRHIIVMRDSDGGTKGGDAYIYDIKSKSWAFGSGLFAAKDHTNFVIDYNGDLVTAEYTGATAQLIYYGGASAEIANIEIATKDIDFGDVGHIKKVYKVYTTYKKTDSGDVANYMLWAIDGNTSFSNTGLTGTWSGSKSDWDVAVHTFATPKECQSIRLLLDPGSPAVAMFFNDISIEYRQIDKRVS